MILPSISSDFPDENFTSSPEPDRINRCIRNLRDRFLFPDVSSTGILEVRVWENGGFVYSLDPLKNDWLSKSFREMLNSLIRESPLNYFKIVSQINIGRTLTFHGQVRNVRAETQELLKFVSEKNSYGSYDITYYAVGPLERSVMTSEFPEVEAESGA